MNASVISEYLNYDSHTGVFTWRKMNNRLDLVGRHAGTKTSKGYIDIYLLGRLYKAHRLAIILSGKDIPSGFVVDHINGNRSDNRICNLRVVNHSQSAYNTKLKSTNTSGVKGVCFIKDSGLWQARISVGKKRIILGCFRNKEDAIKKRKSSQKIYHGQYARQA